MRKKDMKTGVIYGYQVSDNSEPLPCIILDTTVWECDIRYGKTTWRKPVGNRYSHSYDWNHQTTTGYLILKDKDVKKLEEIAFLSRNIDINPVTIAELQQEIKSESVSLHVVDPRHIQGPFEEVKKAYDKLRHDRQTEYESRVRQVDINTRKYDAIQEKLAEQDIQLGWMADFKVSLTIEDLSNLLGLSFDGDGNLV